MYPKCRKEREKEKKEEEENKKVCIDDISGKVVQSVDTVGEEGVSDVPEFDDIEIERVSVDGV